jgi:hypothetical protein
LSGKADAFCDEWTFAGTNTGTLLLPDGRELPATGKQVEIKGMEYCLMRDGKLIVNTLYYDNMAVAYQLGLINEAREAHTRLSGPDGRSRCTGVGTHPTAAGSLDRGSLCRDRGSFRDVAEDRSTAVRRLDDPPGPQFIVYIALWVLIPSDE